MAKPNTTEALKCMNCGTPIKSGFFCAKCQSGEIEVKSKEDGWRGSRFTGDAKKKRQQQLLMEDLMRWGKMLLILAIIGGVGYGGWAMFGTQIKAKIAEAQNVTKPKEKYDPTQDAAVSEEANAGGKNGKRAFTPIQKQNSIDGGN
ncbi:MAG: hypothetical protein QOJ65_1969 [Fimbriimonadaceae bacterium]|jgi:hypothetical protein|nr:hypothetical protein [Fimbriimonadaceae bacterium]